VVEVLLRVQPKGRVATPRRVPPKREARQPRALPKGPPVARPQVRRKAPPELNRPPRVQPQGSRGLLRQDKTTLIAIPGVPPANVLSTVVAAAAMTAPIMPLARELSKTTAITEA